MRSVESRGLCRLMLRVPAWRAELLQTATEPFLKVCAEYELAWDAINGFSTAGATNTVEEFKKVVEFLEGEALLIALRIH